MMHTIGDWLGLKRGSAVIGLHVSPSHLSMAVVRPDPLRLVGLGWQPTREAAVVHDEVRLALTLAGDLSSMVRRLRPADGVGVVAAIETKDDVFRAMDGETSSPCPVRQSAHDRLVGALHGAGLKLLRVDPVPAALARLARQAHPGMAALKGAHRWSIITGDGYTEAERVDHSADPRVRIGLDLSSVQPLTSPPIKVARKVASVVDFDRDAVAIGAALAGFDLTPLVDVQPTPEGRSGDWTMQQVAGPRQANQPTNWAAPTLPPTPGKVSM